MARTLLTSREIGSVQRNDFDITTSGEAVIRKIIAGTNITLSSTGVDTGTGDVTINATGGGGSLTVATSAILSGTANRLLYENSGNLLSESANLTFDGTNLGVGMTGSYPLDVTGLSRFSSGIGLEGTTPVTTSSIIGTKAVTGGGSNFLNFTLNNNQTSSGGTTNGILFSVKHNVANSTTASMQGISGTVTNVTGSTTSNILGATIAATNSATTTTIRAAEFDGNNTSTTTNLYGGLFKLQNIGASASATNATSLQVILNNLTSGATISTHRGLSFDTWNASAGGTVITTNQLIYADTTTNTGTNKWGLYFLPDMPSYHVGKLGLGSGTDTPTARLQVRDTTEQLRLEYDVSNYTSLVTNSTGQLAFTTTGTKFTFNKNVEISNNILKLGDASYATTAGGWNADASYLQIGDVSSVVRNSINGWYGTLIDINRGQSTAGASQTSGIRVRANNSKTSGTGYTTAVEGFVGNIGDSTGAGNFQAIEGITQLSNTAAYAEAGGFNLVGQSTAGSSVSEGNAIRVYGGWATNWSITDWSLYKGMALNSGGAVTNLYGLNFSSWSGSNITNSYGIYMDTSIDRGSTLKYAIYSLSTSPSLFTGKVGMGSGVTAPSARLQVRDTTEQLRLEYDASNYCSLAVDSFGEFTMSSTGTVFNFANNIAVGGSVTVSGDPYSGSWNGSLSVPTKNDVYDKIETLRTTVTEVELNFNTGLVNKFTITDATVASTNKILVYPSPNPGTNRIGNDWQFDSCTFTAVAGTGNFTIYANTPSKIYGIRKVYYQVI